MTGRHHAVSLIMPRYHLGQWRS